MKLVNIIWFLLFCIPFESFNQSLHIRKYYDSDSTNLKEIIEITKSDSLLSGTYFSFHQNGAPMAKGFYKKSIPDSLWTYYYQNGKKKAEGYFTDGEQTGTWTYFYENGSKKAEGYVDRGIKNGFWTNYYENGQIKNEGSYWDDLKNGIWNYFYEDGKLKAQAYYENGRGTYKEFYTNGTLKSEGENNDDKSEGPWKFYWETGELQAEGSYINGLREGYWKFYHKNGSLSAEGKYQNGQRTGLWKYYFENGKVRSSGMLNDDRKEGQWKLYYESGEVQGVGSFEEDDGVLKEYYPSGKLKAVGTISEGRKEGTWNYYNENGEKDGEAVFENGKGEYTGYYPDGSIKMTGPIEGSKRVGMWTLFDEEGSIAGTYQPIYEEDKPVFRLPEDEEDTEIKGSSDIPEYKFKSRNSRYFDGRINEYKGIIIGTNPLWMLVGQLPVSLEYYMQERLGYEIEYRLFWKPFFQNPGSIQEEELYNQGNGLSFRQKFYSKEGQYGMLYFGHEISFNRIKHSVNLLDQTVLPFEIREISATETTGAYGLLVGWRWMRSAGNSGFASDVFVGVDIGFRQWEKLYDDSMNDTYFESLNQSSLYIPLVFGVNIGWTGPKQKNKQTEK